MPRPGPEAPAAGAESSSSSRARRATRGKLSRLLQGQHPRHRAGQRVLPLEEQDHLRRGRGRHAPQPAERARLRLGLRRQDGLLERQQPAAPLAGRGPRSLRRRSTRHSASARTMATTRSRERSSRTATQPRTAFSAHEIPQPLQGRLALVLHAAARRQPDLRGCAERVEARRHRLRPSCSEAKAPPGGAFVFLRPLFLRPLGVVHPGTRRGARCRSRRPCSARAAPRASAARRFASPRAVSRTRSSAASASSAFRSRAHPRGPLELPPLGFRVEAVQLDFLGIGLGVLVDADDHLLARFDLLRVRGTRPARSRSGRSPARPRRPRRRARRPARSARGPAARARSVSSSMKYAPPSGSAVSVPPPSCGEDLLRPQRDPDRVLGRQRERLVEAVRVDRLRAAADRRQRLDRVTRTMLFSGCCAVSVEPPVCAWKRSACAFGFVAPKRSRMIRRPQPARGAELRHLLEEVVVRVEEEREPLAELVRREPGVDGRLRSRRSRSRA